MYRNTATLNRPCTTCEPCHECGQPADVLVPMLYPSTHPRGVAFCSIFCRDFTLLIWRGPVK